MEVLLKNKDTENDQMVSPIPLISIIIPALNEERNISDCLLGIRRINYPAEKIEVIVVDNGSSDKTMAIARSYGAAVYEVRDATVGGLRNFGAQRSSGEYLAFLDADCIPPENWLLESLTTFNNNLDVVVVGGVISLPKEETVPWVELYWVNYLSSKFNSEINLVDTIASFCFLTRKKMFESVNGFNVSLATCEDYDLGYRLHELGQIVINTKIKVIHLGNAKSLPIFWRRQVWQGRSNVHNLLAHKFSLKELPSVVAPTLFTFSCIGLLFACLLEFNGRNTVVFFCMFIFFLIPLLATIKVKDARSLKKIAGYWVLWCVYLMARGLGMLYPRIK